jgi:aspartate carbamoyltransferase regulatory subunit
MLDLDVFGTMNNPINTPKLEQKNYIQINNAVLSQDELKQLNED